MVSLARSVPERQLDSEASVCASDWKASELYGEQSCCSSLEKSVAPLSGALAVLPDNTWLEDYINCEFWMFKDFSFDLERLARIELPKSCWSSARTYRPRNILAVAPTAKTPLRAQKLGIETLPIESVLTTDGIQGHRSENLVAKSVSRIVPHLRGQPQNPG